MHSLDSSLKNILPSSLDLIPLFFACHSHASGLLRYTLQDLPVIIEQNLLTQVYFYCHMIQVKDLTPSPSISNEVIDVTSVHAYFAVSFNLIAAAVEQCVCCYHVTWRGGNVRNCFISQIRVGIL